MSEIKSLPFNSISGKEIEIIKIGKEQNINSSIQIPYRTDFYQIIWFKSGKLITQLDFQEINFEPNTILFVNKNKIQSYIPIGEVEAEIILFTENFFNQSISSISHIDRCFLFSDLLENSMIRPNNPSFDLIKNLLFDEYYNNIDKFAFDILRNLLHCVVLMAEREIQKDIQLKSKGIDLDIYLKFKDLLNKNFMCHKDVEYYCKLMNITEKRIYRAVTIISGITPKAIIHNKIILESKWLLSNESMSIKEISSKLGFSESTNFIKYFKKHTGIIPSDYSRKKLA